MSTWRSAGLLGLAITMGLSSIAGAADSPPNPIAEVRALSQGLLDALGRGDASIWDRYLDKDVTVVDESGAILRKNELLAGIAPLPAGTSGKISIETFEARQFGDLVIAAHRDAGEQRVFEQTVRPQFQTVETWIRKDGHWKLIAAQTMSVETPPKAQALPVEWLKEYEGTYAASDSAEYKLKIVDGELRGERSGKEPKTFQTEARDVFFIAGQPGRMIMLRDKDGRLVGFADRRSGQEIIWRRR